MKKRAMMIRAGRPGCGKALCLAVLLLVCALVLAGSRAGTAARESAAGAPGYDARLDAAFSAGKVSLAGTEHQLVDPDTCEIILPPEEVLASYGLEKESAESAVRDMVKDGKILAFSYSPDGQTAICIVPVVNAYRYFAVTQGRMTMLYPTDRRGLGELKECVEKSYPALYGGSERVGSSVDTLDLHGFIWSPDGRYFCPLSRYVAMMKFSRPADPNAAAAEVIPVPETNADAYWIGDTQTGELFALDAFVSPDTSGRYGLWLDADFSEDSRFLDVVYLGRRFSESRRPEMKMLRYDLSSGQEQAFDLSAFGEKTIMPGIIRLREGQYRGVANMPVHTLVRFGTEGPAEETALFESEYSTRQIVARYIVSSAQSGESLIFVSFSRLNGLMHLRAGEDQAPDQSRIWIPSAATGRLEAYTADELIDACSSEDYAARINAFLSVRDARFSPDGRYALVLCGTEEDQPVTVLLVRLSDMDSLPVEGFEDITVKEAGRMLDRGANLISWTEAGILVNTGTGTLYEIRGD